MFIYILFSAISMHAQEDTILIKVLEKISQTTPIHYANKVFSFPRKKMLFLPGEDLYAADPHFQKMGKAILIDAGIPAAWHVPFYKLPFTHKAYNHAAALAEPFGIYINHKSLRLASYGKKRFVLAHEAMHIKFHDVAMNFFVPYGIGSIYLTYSNKLNKKYISNNKASNSIKLINLLIAWGIAYRSSDKYHKFCEGRADKKAIKLLQCTHCVEDAVESRGYYRVPYFSNEGYLCGQELLKYNKLYNPENKLCDYHS